MSRPPVRLPVPKIPVLPKTSVPFPLKEFTPQNFAQVATADEKSAWEACYETWYDLNTKFPSGVIIVPQDLARAIAKAVRAYMELRAPRPLRTAQWVSPKSIPNEVQEWVAFEDWVIENLLQKGERVLAPLTIPLFKKLKFLVRNPIALLMLLLENQEQLQKFISEAEPTLVALLPAMDQSQVFNAAASLCGMLTNLALFINKYHRPQDSGPRKFDQAFQRPRNVR